MIDASVMHVTSVRVLKAKHFPKTDKCGAEFWTREIRVTTDSGEQLTIKLFADEADSLNLLDQDREPLERMPDPPDCPACGGTGQRTLHNAAQNDPCPECNGEGVAQF